MYRFVLALLCIASSSFAQEADLRDRKFYDLEIVYELKIKPLESTNTYSFEKQRMVRQSSKQQAFIKIKLSVVRQATDYRVRIINNANEMVLTKKLKENVPVVFDLGYPDDIKQRNSPDIFHVFFLNKEKQTMNQVLLEVKEDGTFLVNKEVFGKF